MTKNLFLQIAQTNQKKAFEIIRKLKIYDYWKELNAEIHLIGSLKTKLLMKHLDIDFHIYTKDLDIESSFKIIGKIAATKGVEKLEFINLSAKQDACFEWHLFYKDDNQNTWQIDMIHILKGSKYDGFFEKIADQINACMTQMQKETILRLKYETPDNEKIAGIEYCRAVLEGHIQTFSDFQEWRRKNPMTGILEWLPSKKI